MPNSSCKNVDSQVPSQTKLVANGSKQSADKTGVNEDPNLENNLGKYFARAHQYAKTWVVGTLDPLKPMYKLTSPPRPPRSDVLWKGHPVQEKLLDSCRSYTTQWLSERDTSCWANSESATATSSSKGIHNIAKDPELVRDIGAWSANLACARAKRALLSSGKIHTVPGSTTDLVDAKSPMLSNNNEGILLKVNENTSSRDRRGAAQYACTIRKIKHDLDQVSNNSIIEVASQSNILGSSDRISTENDIVSVEEKDENALPFTANSIRSRPGGHYYETPAAGSHSGSVYSSKSQSSSFGQRAGRDRSDGQGRKRIRKGNNHDDDDDDDSGDDRKLSTQQPSNAMPLQDPSAELACHYHIFNPDKFDENAEDGKKYKRCARGFKDSKDLRDHHKKKHYGPKYFCSRCHQSFDDSVHKAAHENITQRCDENLSTPFPGEEYIMIGTERRLIFEKMKKPRTISHEEHWFDVWCVLFQGYPFPTTPYIQNDVLMVTTFSRIAEDEIPRFLNIVGSQNLPGGIQERTQFLLQFINHIQQRCDELQGRQQSLTGQVHGAEDNMRQTTSQSHTAAATPPHTLVHNNTPSTALYNSNYLSPSYRQMPTVMPTHAYYSAQGWQAYSGSSQPSVGSQDPSFVSPRSSYNGTDSHFNGFGNPGFPEYDFTLDPNFNNGQSYQ